VRAQSGCQKRRDERSTRGHHRAAHWAQSAGRAWAPVAQDHHAIDTCRRLRTASRLRFPKACAVLTSGVRRCNCHTCRQLDGALSGLSTPVAAGRLSWAGSSAFRSLWFVTNSSALRFDNPSAAAITTLRCFKCPDRRGLNPGKCAIRRPNHRSLLLSVGRLKNMTRFVNKQFVGYPALGLINVSVSSSGMRVKPNGTN